MRLRSKILLATLALCLATGALAQYGWQGGGRRNSFNEDPVKISDPEYTDKDTEWKFIRLQYSGFRSYSKWATDYPKAERQFTIGVQRMSRVHANYLPDVVSTDDDRLFQYPWVYAVEVGTWGFNEGQAKRMREYLLRGGFLMVDDFHGDEEWVAFEEGLKRVLPDAVVEDLSIQDDSFHILQDVRELAQVPAWRTISVGETSQKGGTEPHWRVVRDPKGRIIVAICHNMDIGDAWEWADDPRYPGKYASLAYQLGVNYVIYAMTH